MKNNKSIPIQLFWWTAVFLMLFSWKAASAEEGRVKKLPSHTERNGKILGHHVRLEGYASDQSTWAEIRSQKNICDILKKPVKLPPPDTKLKSVSFDIYYTENLKIIYRWDGIIYISDDCQLINDKPSNIQMSIGYAGVGVCIVYTQKKAAEGHCQEYYSQALLGEFGDAYMMPSRTLEKYRVVKDGHCKKIIFEKIYNNGDTINALAGSHVCILPRKEKWRTLEFYGSENQGILLEKVDKNFKENGLHVKATVVEEDIYIDKKILFPHLYTPGFTIEETSEEILDD